MKKILSSLFLFIYAIAFSGMVIKMHYCGGALASWNINKTEDVSCCCKKTNDENSVTQFQSTNNIQTIADADDCCSNKTISLKIDGDYHFSASTLNFDWITQVIVPTPSFSITYQDNISTNNEDIVYQANAPPLGLWQNIPLYILQSKYLVYDIA